MARKSKAADPFRWFDSSPEVIRLVVMMYVKFPLSLRNVEDLLHERGIDICRETVRLWWNRFGPMFAVELRRKRVQATRQQSSAQLHQESAEASRLAKGDHHRRLTLLQGSHERAWRRR
jgi:putative transposase